MLHNFKEAIDYLQSLDNWEASPATAWDPTNNMARMEALLRLLENPQESFKTIIVGGTNGKGSTSTLIADILNAHQINTISFNSPHIKSIKERVRLNNKELKDSLWVYCANKLQQIDNAFRKLSLGMFTSFEAITALAALAGKEQHVEYGIFEVGLGGRFDSTNAWDSELAVLTSVAKDHTQILGDTLEKITTEKIMICRTGKYLVTSLNQEQPVKNVIQNKSLSLGFEIVWANPNLQTLELKNKPDWFAENSALAFEAAKKVLDSNFKTELALEAVKNFQIAGRFEIKRENPYFILDAAHNPPAIKVLISSLSKLAPNWHITCAFTKGHNYEESLKHLINFADQIFITEARSPKKVRLDEVQQEFGDQAKIEFISDINLALEKTQQLTDKNVCICGSFYLL